jgi:hypothetical protein
MRPRSAHLPVPVALRRVFSSEVAPRVSAANRCGAWLSTKSPSARSLFGQPVNFYYSARFADRVSEPLRRLRVWLTVRAISEILHPKLESVIALAYPAVLLDSVRGVRDMGDRRMPSLCIRS